MQVGVQYAPEPLVAAMHALELEPSALQLSLYVQGAQLPRTRHFVSNVRARELDAGQTEVRSNLLLYRNRGSDPGHDLLSGERIDALRRQDGGWRLARRRVLLDQATLGTKNLGIFL